MDYGSDITKTDYEVDDATYLANSLHTSLCPKILGNEFIKKVLILQLFTNPLSNEKFHSMLIGSPGCGKTDMIEEMSIIRPRSKYYSRRLTKVGLEETIEECDGNMIMIDDFHSVDNDTQDSFLELMQSGRMTIDIHNRHRELRARSNICVACNPKFMMWVKSRSKVDQLPLKLNILTRFNIIMPVYKANSKRYREIAINACSSSNNDERIEQLSKMIEESINKIKTIELPEVIAENIADYIEDLEIKSIYKKVISAPRMIHGMISLVKARTRMCQRKVVSEHDYEYVKDLYDKFYLVRSFG